MESALNEVGNPPPLQRIEFSLSSNTTTTTTNSNNNGLQQTLEKLLLGISNMETSIMICKQGRSRFILKLYLVELILSENKIVFPSMLLLVRNLVEEIYIPQLRSWNPGSQRIAMLLIK